MRGNELLDKMEFIDPAYIEAAETAGRQRKSVWPKWGAIAACFCLIAAGALAIPRLMGTPGATPVPDPGGTTIDRVPEPDIYPSHDITPGVQLDEPPEPWTVVYNEAGSVVSADRVYIPGYFTEELDAEELAALDPTTGAGWMALSGHGGFDYEGDLIGVALTAAVSDPDAPVTVLVSGLAVGSCYEIPSEPVVSVCGEVAYTVYQWTFGDTVRLDAGATIGGYPFRFILDTTVEGLEGAKADFQRVLGAFARYGEGRPDLSAVTAEVIPEFIDQKLTLSEAWADPDFGAYMLRAVPDGFQAESIRRYKDQNSDSLSGLWFRGLAELRWEVRAFTEGDAERIAGIQDTERYDLSLYPIPRYESIPAELREVVDDPVFLVEELTLDAVWARAYTVEDAGDVDGWRMSFSVKYGDIIVHVSAKGVDPEWVYRQLTALREG